MSILLAMSLAAAAEPVPELGHRIRIEHPTGAVEADYTTRVEIRHRQIGMDMKPGMPSTAQCSWRADIVVERTARHANGTRLLRQMTRQGVAQGARPGWCAGHRTGIAREVAGRTDAIRAHVAALARADAALLKTELARLDGDSQG